MSTGLIGRKLGMTRVFTEDGAAVPVTVSVRVPFWALRAGDTVSTDVPEPVIDDGWKAADTRAGRPATVRFTDPEKPAAGVIVTV